MLIHQLPELPHYSTDRGERRGGGEREGRVEGEKRSRGMEEEKGGGGGGKEIM